MLYSEPAADLLRRRSLSRSAKIGSQLLGTAGAITLGSVESFGSLEDNVSVSICFSFLAVTLGKNTSLNVAGNFGQIVVEGSPVEVGINHE